MIGTRAAVSAGLAVLGVALLLGPRTDDPSLRIASERLVRQRAADAVRELDEFREVLDSSLEAARSAAAAVLSGSEPPGPRLEEAAKRIAGGEEGATAARHAVESLAAARSAWHPGTPSDLEPIAAGELISIGDQLRGSTIAADRFADLRARANGLPGVLDEALRALEREALDEATDLAAHARADHDAIVAWETDLTTLPVWIETTDAMISAVEQILDATRAGDGAAARRAAEKFAAVGDDAAMADRALRIAMSEGGAALTAAPLERLAALLGGVDDTRAAAEALLQDPGR